MVEQYKQWKKSSLRRPTAWLQRYGVLLLAWCLVASLGRGGSAEAASAEKAKPASERRPVVKRISFAARSDGKGYVVRVQTSDPIKAYGDPKVTSEAIVWTLYNVKAGLSAEKVSGAGPVKSYTVESRGKHLFLRFQLNEGIAVEAEAYRDRASSDLLMNLSYGADPAQVTAAQAADAGAAEASKVRTVSTKGSERWRFDTVVIDAGHGGHDPGAQAYGVDEKDVVLGIALKLGAYIEDRLTGVNVVYTRDSDRFVTLRNRGHIANKAGGKLFVSIHANAARNRSAHGTETYFMGTSKSKAARRVMERENSVIQLEDHPEQYKDFSDQEQILQTLAQSAYLRQSEHIAEQVQEQLSRRAYGENRGVKQARFLVLWAASMPAILVETGFVTNRREASYLNSDRGQARTAKAIFRAVHTFKKQYEKGLSLASDGNSR